MKYTILQSRINKIIGVDKMGVNSSNLNEKGNAKCNSCGKTVFVSNLQSCVVCGKFVCSSCATYRRQGNPHGYVCKHCKSKI